MPYGSGQPGSYLFSLWDGGGNVPPQLAVARRLVERGRRVRILAPRVLRARIEAAGAEFVPLRAVPEHASGSPAGDLMRDWEARTSIGASARVRDRLIIGSALAYARDVFAAIEDERPAVVVADYLPLGAYIAAERAGIPLAVLIHMIYPLPAFGIPPFGQGFQPATGTLGRARDALFARLFRQFYDMRLKELNQARTAMGLSPLSTVLEQVARADRLLVMTSAAFDFPAAALPPNVRYVGPQFEDPAWLEPWQLPHADARPLVLVSLSTTYQRQADLMRRIVAALADMPVRALITLGPALHGETLALPPNAQAEAYAPHLLVCPHADLVVTHGGHGTVMAALKSGVPLVCIPMGRDQADTAARVVWRGAGIRVASDAGVAELRQAMRRVLDEPQFRAGARRVAEGIARESDPALVIDELERLATSPATAVG